jgi:hypothetical protein
MKRIPTRSLRPTERATGAWMATNQGPENLLDRALQKPKGRFNRKTRPATSQRLCTTGIPHGWFTRGRWGPPKGGPPPFPGLPEVNRDMSEILTPLPLTLPYPPC